MDDKVKKNAPQIKDVKDIRQDISTVIQRLESNYSSRESSLVVTKLQEAKHWAGEMLGKLGEDLPVKYKDGPKS